MGFFTNYFVDRLNWNNHDSIITLCFASLLFLSAFFLVIMDIFKLNSFKSIFTCIIMPVNMSQVVSSMWRNFHFHMNQLFLKCFRSCSNSSLFVF